MQDHLAGSERRRIQLNLLEPAVAIKGRLDFPIKGEGRAEMGRVFASMNEQYIAAVRYDKSVHVWNALTGEHVLRFVLPKTVDHVDGVRSVAFDPTNRYLAAGLDTPPHASCGVLSNGRVIVWDLKSGEEVLHTKEKYRVLQVAFSGNGDLICAEAAGGPDGLDKPGRIVSRRSGKFDESRVIHTPYGITAIAIAPGIGVLTGDWHGHVLLWDTGTGRLRAIGEDSGKHVTSLAVSKDGKLVVSGDWNSVARLWRITGGRNGRNGGHNAGAGWNEGVSVVGVRPGSGTRHGRARRFEHEHAARRREQQELCRAMGTGSPQQLVGL